MLHYSYCNFHYAWFRYGLQVLLFHQLFLEEQQDRIQQMYWNLWKAIKGNYPVIVNTACKTCEYTFYTSNMIVLTHNRYIFIRGIWFFFLFLFFAHCIKYIKSGEVALSSEYWYCDMTYARS